MQLLKHFKELSIYPKNAKELKGLILQLAVQGKLTADWRLRHPELVSGSHSASALLASIKAEKEQLIKDKKRKKEIILDNIKREDFIQDIPNLWESARMGNVVEIIRGITFPSSEKSKEDSLNKVPCLRTANVQERIEWDDILYIDKKHIKREDQILKNGDVIMSMANSYELVGKVALIDKHLDREYTLGGFISALRTFKFDHKFLMILLRSPKIRSKLISSSSQTTNIANVSIGKLRPLIIPFPPLAEQKAIVETVNTLFKEVEALEKLTVERISLKEDFITSALRELSTGDTPKEWEYLQKHFPAFMNEESNIKKLRETILQLAIQGKLTANWRQSRSLSGVEGQSAKTLLKSIKAEKAQLTIDKKIKKEKPLPAITADEIPYELPEEWVWCRMRDVSFSIVPNRDKPKTFTGDITWLTTRNLNEYSTRIHHKDGDNKLSREELKEYNARLLPIGSVIMSCVGSFGFSAVLEKEYSCNQQLHCYVPLGNTNPFYLDSIIKSSKKILGDNSSATTIAYLNKTKCDSLLVSLPPLPEQTIIYEKVKMLMDLCDELEKQVVASKANAEMLMQSVLREVFQGKSESKPYPVTEEEIVIAN